MIVIMLRLKQVLEMMNLLKNMSISLKMSEKIILILILFAHLVH